MILIDAKQFFIDKDYDNAIKEYEKILEIYPNDANTFYNMGIILKKQ